MTLSYASNTDSIKAQGELRKVSSKLSKQFERLASGLRINSAADDSAGLAVADSLRADAKVASVAIRNANDGLSLTAVADSALEEIGNILSRMQELAEQSANGVYTTTQRSALQIEFEALGSEIHRISNTTEFNDISLITDSQDISIQVGFDSSANSSITLAGVNGTLNSLGLGSTGGALTYSIISTTSTGSQAAASTALDALTTANQTLSTQRGQLGAAESRLTSAINFVTAVRDEYQTAEAQIRDADVAQEVAELVRLQVIQQAATAIVAQANQQPGLVLALLE